MNDKLNNFIVDITNLIRKRIYIVAPIMAFVFVIVYTIISNNNLIMNIDKDLQNNVANISGVLAGFLFTAYGIFLSLPDNRFITYLKKSKHFDIVLKTLLYGIIFLIIAMLFGIFKLFYKFMLIVFLFGISEVFVSVYYFYKITTLSSKSN